jgi:hypothetical protein
MEGFGVEKMMQQLKDAQLTVTQVVHDKDASTMKQVMTVFEDVEEGLCLSNVFVYFILITKTMVPRISRSKFKRLESPSLSSRSLQTDLLQQ